MGLKQSSAAIFLQSDAVLIDGIWLQVGRNGGNFRKCGISVKKS